MDQSDNPKQDTKKAYDACRLAWQDYADFMGLLSSSPRQHAELTQDHHEMQRQYHEALMNLGRAYLIERMREEASTALELISEECPEEAESIPISQDMAKKLERSMQTGPIFDEAWHHVSRSSQPDVEEIYDKLWDARKDMYKQKSLIEQISSKDIDPIHKYMPKHIRHLIAQAIVAIMKMRVEQADAFDKAKVNVEARELFSVLSKTLKSDQIGYVNGMALNHTPNHGATWKRDVAHYLDELADRVSSMLDDKSELPNHHPSGKKTKKKKVKKSAKDDDVPFDASWCWSEYASGKRIVAFGGSSRGDAVERIERSLGCSMRWVSSEKHEGSRGVQSAIERITNRSFSLVLVFTRFSGHSDIHAIRKACKAHDVPIVYVETGYGVQGIKEAIERHLPPTEINGETSCES